MTRNLRKWGMGWAVAALMASGPAPAADATGSLAVSATVIQSCLVVAGVMAFANYDPTSDTDLDATGTLSIVCTGGTGYAIGLDEGAGSGATEALRKMTLVGDTLDYSLYTSNTYGTVWGTTGGNGNTVSSTGSGIVQLVSVYGRIPKNQSAPTGVYLDTVGVTVTY